MDNYQTLFNANRDGIVFISLDGIIEDVNPSFLSMLGYSKDQLLSTDYYALSDQKWRGIEEQQIWSHGIESGISEEYEKPFIRSNDTLVPTRVRTWLIKDDAGLPFRKMIITSDISSQKELENQLRQSQKMEAVGTLAGGIAHDFNNILASIMGYLELVRYDLPKDSPVQERLARVFKATYRARDLVRQILDFSRQSDFTPKTVRMDLIVKEGMELVSATLPSTIDIQLDIQPVKWRVKIDPTQLHQILMNLCTNAYHAMKDECGELKVSVSPFILNDTSPVQFYNLKPGNYVELKVSDTGIGMIETVQKRIFDPYFTTKDQGEGTGMGLSVVHGIVQNNKGFIQVESQPEKGSCFSILFPAGGRTDKDMSVMEIKALKGNERILLVDDEPDIVHAVQENLARLGYTVTPRLDSQKALTAFEKSPEAFDILVTDYTMPEMTGIQLARKVKSISPGIPVIMCTGNGNVVTTEQIKETELNIDFLLHKPIRTDQLAHTIRKALNQTPSSL